MKTKFHIPLSYLDGIMGDIKTTCLAQGPNQLLARTDHSSNAVFWRTLLEDPGTGPLIVGLQKGLRQVM
jgi:hypothetical protein